MVYDQKTGKQEYIYNVYRYKYSLEGYLEVLMLLESLNLNLNIWDGDFLVRSFFFFFLFKI